ncbi:hypothetical protein [uncultured Cellulomonas sp.]|uniref:hypothetical protein n=1 Tax=uncultured Cellulomonas sp. TaxID=189682 RepID=UPI0028EAF6AD|nr:hypothetical protein [uncultured Cellulomonas sp.]
MRTTTSSLITAACALALVGCAATEPTAQEPSPTAVTAAPAAPTPTPTSSPVPPTDVPADVMLPETAWEPVGPDGARDDSRGAVSWLVDETCAAGSPPDGVAMRTVTQGSGEIESRVGVHQVVVLADADAAVAEADRLAAALTACPQQVPRDTMTYVVEPLDVGAQGIGLATRFYGASDGGPLDDAMGTYLAVTRRGNAVTLVAVHGGEGTVRTAREIVTANARAAWELLCAYDSAGC